MTDVDPFVKYLIKLEADFALPSGFLIGLPGESDWSFTIKIQSLVEAALTQAILAEVHEPRLDELLGGLPILGRHSKVAHAEALGLLSKSHSDFIKRLAKIRNAIVHRLESLSFTFPEYLASLGASDRQNTLNELLFLAGGPSGKAGETFARTPRLVVWAHALAIVTHLVAHKTLAAVSARLSANYHEFAEQVLGPFKES